MSRTKRVVFYVILAVLMFGTLRIFDYIINRLILTSFDTSFYTMPPNSPMLGTNELGLRSPPLRKETGQRTILILGDSMVLGLGVQMNETFVHHAAQRLQSAGHDVELINAGISALSPKNQYGLYLHLREKIRPDVVILGLYMNDVNETGDNPLFQIRRKTLKRRALPRLAYWLAPYTTDRYYRAAEQEKFNSIVQVFGNVTSLHHALGHLSAAEARDYSDFEAMPDPGDSPMLAANAAQFQSFAGNFEVSDAQFASWYADHKKFFQLSLAGQFNYTRITQSLLSPDFVSNTLNLQGGQAEQHEEMKYILHRLIAQVRADGAQFGLMYIPTDEQYDGRKQEFMRRAGFTLDPAWLGEDTALERDLARFAADQKVPFLNLTPACKQHADQVMTFKYDEHLNPTGHAVLAEPVERFLVENFLTTNGSE